MKRSYTYIIACVVAWFFAATAMQAQVGEARHNFCLGFTGGIAMNQIGFDPTIKQKWHMGPTFGIVARYTSERYFKAFCALQVELNYTTLGWRENVLNANSEPLPDTYRRDQHYLQLPMLARLAWGRESRGFMGYFLAGPQVGYCFKEKPRQATLHSMPRETPTVLMACLHNMTCPFKKSSTMASQLV